MHLSSICNCFIIVCSSPKLRIVPNRKKPPRYCKCIHYTLTFVRTGRTKQKKFGSKVGIYSSFQALGMGMAPIIGGISADTNWRAAFWGTIFVSAILSLFPPEGGPKLMPTCELKIYFPESYHYRRSNILSSSGTDGNECTCSSSRVTNSMSQDQMRVLSVSAISSFLLGPIWGGVDKLAFINRQYHSDSTRLLCRPSRTQWATFLGMLWFMAGGAIGCMSVMLQALGATTIPNNKGGSLSFILSLFLE